MARVHVWQFLLTDVGTPIADANIYIYQAGTLIAANVYLAETGGSTVTSVEGGVNVTTDSNGKFEFWIGDAWETGGYSPNQKFKIAWYKIGIADGEIDYVNIFPGHREVDTTSTNTDKNKLVSNNLAKGWEDNKGLSFVSSDDTTAGYLNGKLIGGTGCYLLEGSPGGNETLTINTSAAVFVSSNDTTSGYLNGKLVAGEGIDFTEGNDGGDETLTILGEDATATNKGIVELATSAETITGSDNTRAVTPAGLQAKVASATVLGIVELATDAESITGTDTSRAITAANLNAVLDDRTFNKNAIINGDFNVWQRGTSFTAIVTGAYSADRWRYDLAGTAVHTISRDTDVPTQAESGHKSNYSIKIDCTTIDAAIGATDQVILSRRMEGYNFAPFMGKTATLSFWVKAVKTGIYCVSFTSGDGTRSYVVEYTINSASTWEKKTITLTFSDSGGNWDYTTGIGLRINWALAAGSDYQGVADTWNAVFNLATSNQVNGVDHTDNNFWLAQVQFELGSVATDFEYRQFGDELAKCKRYYERIVAGAVYTAFGSGVVESATAAAIYTSYVRKRVAPTFTQSNTRLWDATVSPAADGIGGVTSIGLDCARLIITATGGGMTAGRGVVFDANNNAAAYIEFSSEL